MTRAAKRDVDRDALRGSWERQAVELGFDAHALAKPAPSREAGRGTAAKQPAAEAVEWAVEHLSEREAVFARTGLLSAALAWSPGAVDSAGIEQEIAGRVEGRDAACRKPARRRRRAHHRPGRGP